MPWKWKDEQSKAFIQLPDNASDDLSNNNFTKSHMSRTIFHGGEQLACYDGRIYMPQKLRKNVVTEYHE